MEEASLQLTFAFIGIIIGIIIGAFSYRVLSKGQRHVSNMQLRLLESERQVAELKADMSSHLSDTHRQVSDVRTTLDQLDQHLRQQAGQWGSRNTLFDHAASPLQTASQEPLAGEADAAKDHPPRDYADGQNGTLSEDFGLKAEADEEAAQAPQPPRY
ncbi:MAG: YhcB family protein [Halomonas sp.]|nr:DUF1043 family protein [Halomonas sp.]MDN6297152.1 YhcB family protein [Halomonas sp.]MDN6313956.1 YhcB family protein [Halomonas sp.]MDN6335501.1 YhcB family protein [Halomonas sp.]